MSIEQRKSHFIELGKFLNQFRRDGMEQHKEVKNNLEFFEPFKEQIERAIHYNGWFTKDNILFALEGWSESLTPANLGAWSKPYNFENIESKTVGIIMAGNIPLVGFHDFISVLIAGHKVLVKQSSNDKNLLPILANYLISLDPDYEEKIEFTEDRMNNFDAVIATGSNNTSRYFEYYFANKKSIIRKNRNSVAILTGDETPEDLEALGHDIFRYFGLGCRSVSKLYVPENYDFDAFYKALVPWASLMNHAKYANNYDYNKAVYLMSEFKMLDNGFLVLKEDQSFGSPIATLFYEKYADLETLKATIEANKENLQCIVANNFMENGVSFGKTQYPQLWDYADNIDTLEFLENI
ncbi:acyl-CoA reductase LuxC [Gillisia sp. Hel_I_86]|uniref:acyl-CoA reductase n=1 Tax=Gillisia sp. Hel_I_86 TaxID=1249981 RepID=UPI00119AAF03|nr:acyl-CoA reductase [Gillisia sp. Hel_I_86]TVZ28523.1 acyl-CoA reductase LuxC [Gillisia sp. Hel_I_86]